MSLRGTQVRVPVEEILRDRQQYFAIDCNLKHHWYHAYVSLPILVLYTYSPVCYVIHPAIWLKEAMRSYVK